MAYSGRRLETTIAAGEDLNTSAFEHHAIALDDGKLANNAEEASGILLNKPKSGEGLTLGYIGEQKFAAGAAITKGGKLTVATSGWFTTADSNDVIVGECKETVTSGSLGTGIFSFPQANGNTPENIRLDVTLKDAVIAGVAVDLVSAAVGANAREAHVISQSVGVSGTAYSMLLWGKGLGRMDPARAAVAGDNLTTTASGYFTLCASGYFSNATAIEAIGSGALGTLMFWGAEHGYKPTSYN